MCISSTFDIFLSIEYMLLKFSIKYKKTNRAILLIEENIFDIKIPFKSHSPE
jgi:hypothetical protein